MLKSYFKTAWRNLKKNKFYSFINLFGLSSGIAFCIVILLFLRITWSHDTSYKNTSTLYTLTTNITSASGNIEQFAEQPAELIKALNDEFPEISRLFFGRWGDATVTANNKTLNEHVLFCSADVFEMFDIDFKYGNPNTALRHENEIVLSDQMAKKYFADENPIGKILSFETRKGLEKLYIVGIAKPARSNSSLKDFDCIAHYSKYELFEQNKSNWTTMRGNLVLQLQDKTRALSIRTKLPSFVNKYKTFFVKFWQGNQILGLTEKSKSTYTLAITPMSEIHSTTNIQGSLFNSPNTKLSYWLAGIALLVLIIACINFTVLTIAQSAGRTKEVGMRKVHGATKHQIVFQFLLEALLTCLITMTIGIMFAKLLLPAFNEFFSSDLTFENITDKWTIILLLGLLLFTALASGSYPAFFLSQFQPIKILKGKIKFRGNNFITQSLIVFQFGFSILLIAITIGMKRQVNYILSKDLLFSPSNVINIRTRTGFYPNQPASLVERFSAETNGHAGINGLSGIGQFELRKFNYQGQDLQTVIIPADSSFVNTLKITMADGRNFKSSTFSTDEAIVNETFAKQIVGNGKLSGVRLTGINDSTLNGLHIVGIVKDFHLLSLKKKIVPIVILPMKVHDGILVRISPNSQTSTINFLQKAWSKVSPGNPFEFQVLDQALQNDYREDIKWQKIASFASLFAILLACLGLLGLISISIANRTKEIGIRKVLGATDSSIISIIVKNLAGLILLGNIIGLPLAHIYLSKWIQNYSYRVELEWWVYAVAGLTVLFIALATISSQSVNAARMKPVKSLRAE